MADRRSEKSDDYEAKLIAFVRKAWEDAAAIERVLEACKAKQGPRFHDDPYNRGWDNALAYVESRALDGDV